MYRFGRRRCQERGLSEYDQAGIYNEAAEKKGEGKGVVLSSIDA